MKIAEPTVERLVQYIRYLQRCREAGKKVISSQEIGDALGIKASQVRKDLSYFGEIGKRGVGYDVEKLYQHLNSIFAPPKTWKIAMIGIGNLGEALLGYEAFESEKFRIVALFDIDPDKVGRKIHDIPCYDVGMMPRVLNDEGVEVLIITTPSSAAQEVVDKATSSASIKGILNFAPTALAVPEHVILYNVDIFVELEKLLFYIKLKEESGKV